MTAMYGITPCTSTYGKPCTADEFVDFFADRQPILLDIAPDVAANLRSVGDPAQAAGILRRTEPTLLRYLKNGQPTSSMLATLASYKAVDGRTDEAVSLLNQAVGGGWLPTGTVDIAQEPCFEELVNRADFHAVRQRILARVAEERRKVSPALLESSGFRPKMAA